MGIWLHEVAEVTIAKAQRFFVKNSFPGFLLANNSIPCYIIKADDIINRDG
jgi:hypothetical protein